MKFMKFLKLKILEDEWNGISLVDIAKEINFPLTVILSTNSSLYSIRLLSLAYLKKAAVHFWLLLSMPNFDNTARAQ